MLIGLRDWADLELGVSQSRVDTEVPVGTRTKIRLSLQGFIAWLTASQVMLTGQPPLVGSELLWVPQPGVILLLGRAFLPIWAIAHRASTKQ